MQVTSPDEQSLSGALPLSLPPPGTPTQSLNTITEDEIQANLAADIAREAVSIVLCVLLTRLTSFIDSYYTSSWWYSQLFGEPHYSCYSSCNRYHLNCSQDKSSLFLLMKET